MCGIAGVLAPVGQVDPGIIEKMVSALAHRGPDDSGVRRIQSGDRECWLGSRRLAIIDLSTAGRMPMVDPPSANWIVYNGEVYNFDELRKEQVARGEKFVSRTDTEVILKLYRREGIGCLRRLRGMFALAIWDDKARQLILARDRVGKKPLYFASTHGLFAFSSEVRALLRSGLVDPQLDPEALDVFLANGFLVSPWTLVRDVESLLPGQWMRVSAAGRILNRGSYWKPPRPQRGTGGVGSENTEALLSAFGEAVGIRRVSDVPLGVFLSGGVDSSAVAAALRRLKGDVRTFSVSFTEKEYDESAFSRKVASSLGTGHTEIKVSREDLVRWLPGALGGIDQPSFDGVNTYLVSRAAKDGGLTVALSGIGGDELFGGYPFFRSVPPMSALASLVLRMPRALASVLLSRLTVQGGAGPVAGPMKFMDLVGSNRLDRLGSLVGAYQVAQLQFPFWSRETLLSEDVGHGVSSNVFGLPPDYLAFLDREIEGLDRMSALSLITWRLFLGERCLRDTDSMSMAVSLEVRAPFVDHVFVENLFRIPGGLRCTGAPNKPFEWNIFDEYLGPVLPRRRKQGFIIPAQEWLKDEPVRGMMRDTLLDPALARSVGLNPLAVSGLWEDFGDGSRGIPWTRVWAIFVLLDWCRRYGVRL